MSFVSEFKNNIFDIHASVFEKKALDVFKFQYENCQVYQSYVNLLPVKVEEIRSIYQIPFLPIRFFKQYEIKSVTSPVQREFHSSGTTGMLRSRHPVFDVSFYQKMTEVGFEKLYGPLVEYDIMALLPNYEENPNSSLICMVQHFIEKSGSKVSGFYDQDSVKLALAAETGKKKMLIGVSFALLDLTERKPSCSGELIVMETGGMKGRRKELVRSELHTLLKNGFALQAIHSEYGMTELLSQAYALEGGIFQTPNWMKVLIRDTHDPFSFQSGGRGGINVIDLANIETCSFIETEDVGRMYPDGRFEVLGRFDHSDVRGCNLMVY